MNQEYISILLADDHKIYREALALILNKDPSFRIVGQCGNGPEAAWLYLDLRPDIILIDITMQTARGFDTAGKILSACPEASIIGLSTFFIESWSQRVMASGAKGYLARSMSYTDMLEGIRKVHTDNNWRYGKARLG